VRVEQRSRVSDLVGEQPAHLRHPAGLEHVIQQSVRVHEASVDVVERSQGEGQQRVVVERARREAERARKRAGPVRVGGAVDVRCGALAPFLERQREIALVGVLASGEEPGLRVVQYVTYVSERRDERRAKLVGRREGREAGENAKQAGVILRHLLEVRYAPVARRRIPEEAALDVVVHAAARHAEHRARNHVVKILLAAQAPLHEQKLQKLRLRKLGRLAESAVLFVECGAKRLDE